MSRRASLVTVASVVRAAGVRRECEVAWAVGRLAARLWREREGCSPSVALVPKSGGGGTHHMAVYPRTFRPTLMRLVRLAATAQAAPDKPARRSWARQADLFGRAR